MNLFSSGADQRIFAADVSINFSLFPKRKLITV